MVRERALAMERYPDGIGVIFTSCSGMFLLTL
jgi:hypothetical protein